MQNVVISKLPHGLLAGLLTVMVYRIAGHGLSLGDWVIVTALGITAMARALMNAAGPFSSMFTRAFAYVIGSAIVETLALLHLLPEDDRAALRKRLRMRFVRRF